MAISNRDYQEKLKKLSDFWLPLKDDIIHVRNGGEKNDLFNHSEAYFVLADHLVSSAENYSSIQLTHLPSRARCDQAEIPTIRAR